MSYDYGAGSTDKVVVPAATSINDIFTGTCAVWVYPPSIAPGANRWIYQKGITADSRVFRIQNTGGTDYLQFFSRRVSSHLQIRDELSAIPAAGANKWNYWVAVWDENGANADQQLYGGDLTTAVAETAGPYDQQTAGGGAGNSDVGNDMYIGNQDNTATNSWDGRIGIMMLWDVALTDNEIIAQQFAPRPVVQASNIQLFMHFGFHGASQVYDQSGNGNDSSSTTGIDIAGHVPLGPVFGFDRYSVLPTPPAPAASLPHLRQTSRHTMLRM